MCCCRVELEATPVTSRCIEGKVTKDWCAEVEAYHYTVTRQTPIYVCSPNKDNDKLQYRFSHDVVTWSVNRVCWS